MYSDDEIDMLSLSDDDGGADSDFDFDCENSHPNRSKPVKSSSKVSSKPSSKSAGKTSSKSSAKPGKKAAKPKKAAATSVASVTSDTSETSAPPAAKKSAAPKKKKNIEETYKKLKPIEHILVRPDTYIGSIERITQPMYVLDLESNKIVNREITYTPGLYKIFDEIVVNAADNRQRDPAGMDRLDIDIDPENNSISVRNNGKGIPIAMHSEHKCYVPELIFGHLLTGSNFDDDERKTTGGRNGYGAKLANIFSTEFIIECYNAEENLLYRQSFTNNMQTKGKPELTTPTKKGKKKAGDYTRVTFHPDLARFKMERLDDDIVALLCKRAYDVAGCMASTRSLTAGDGKPTRRLQVHLNGTEVPVKDFRSYIGMYEGMKPINAYDTHDGRWEFGVAESDGSFGQISFVNSICTYKGGQHVDYIANQVVASLGAVVKKKNKGGTEVGKAGIKNHLCVFVNCLIENPAFDSQTKECLTTRSKAFGSRCELSAEFLKKVEKSDIVASILSFAKYQEDREKKKTQGKRGGKKLTGIEKLDDANNAGTKKGSDCTMILTEGDSAKTLAVAGISVVGRDWYGCYPLKGKLLNVRDCSHAQFMKNEEIQNIVRILGLEFKKEYTSENVGSLRYGHLMIMADQDHDGSHIKGLVINFIHKEWPSLLNIKGFMKQFITPIVKVTKGKAVQTFFTIPEYLTWKEETGNSDKWKAKYYKGLGTSTTADAKEYFSDLEKHEIPFQTISLDVVPEAIPSANDMELDLPKPEHVSSWGSDLIDMAFSKKRVSDRKDWLNNTKTDVYMNYSEATSGVLYSEFINKELIQFSLSDNKRSIPHSIDGFKPSQRKVLFACIKKRLIKDEYKVAQLAGYTAEHSAYHHGENSLAGTIVNMAQTFVGSNNINLLTPSGQFGSRRLGGKDSASPRYIFTKLEAITRQIFHPDDDKLLTYLEDDGLSIEPEFYVPVLPMILVNGADGIGTGWSTKIPNYDPRDVIKNLRLMIAGNEPEAMHPSFKRFIGDMTPDPSKQGSYKCVGKIERTDDTTLVITELPIKLWTQDYKKFLEEVMTGGEGKKYANIDLISDFKENHTEHTVHFLVTAPKENIDKWEKDKDGLYGKFKLVNVQNTSNMTLFDIDQRIYKFETAQDILKAFFGYRMEMYVKRKAMLLKEMGRDLSILNNKARFIKAVCSGELVVSNRKRAAILADLKNAGYDTFSNKTEEDADDEDSVDTDESYQTLSKGYEYLLGMKIWSLTYERVEQLLKQVEEKEAEVRKLEATSPAELWLSNLHDIDVSLDEIDNQDEIAAEEELELIASNKKGRGKTPKKKRRAPAKKKAPLVKKKPIVATKLVESTVEIIDEPLQLSQETETSKADSLQVSTALEPAILLDDSSDDDDIVPLSERLAMQLHVSPVPKMKKRSIAKTKAAVPKKRSSPKNCVDEEISSLDLDNFEPVNVTPGPKRSKPTTTKQTSMKTFVEEVTTTKAPEIKASKKAAPARTKKAPVKAVKAPVRAKAKKAPAPARRRKIIEESEEESESDDFSVGSSDESDSDIEVIVPVASTRPQRAGRAAARKPVSYTVVDSESDSEDESELSLIHI